MTNIPRVSLKSLVVVFFLLLLNSCGLKVGNVDLGKMYDTASAATDAAKDFTIEDEEKLSRVISSRLLGASKYYENEPLQQYVSNVGQYLVMQLPEQKYKWHFVVLEDEMFNAYTAPAGMVFINTGLLEQLNSEAQLAAILAHEIIHAYRSHHMHTIQSNAQTTAWSNAFSLAAAQSKSKKIQASKKIWNTVGGQITNIYFRGFDKELEFEADYQGMFLMTKAGYDPYALIEVIQIIQGIEPEDVWFKQFYNTHPKPAERLDAIFDTIDSKLADYSPVAILESRYNQHKPR
jgi:predicted Zn-dependent protease